MFGNPQSPSITLHYALFVDMRAERRAVGLSQSQLAPAAGVPQLELSAYENGRRTPSPNVLERIKGALAVRPSARVEQHRDSIRALVTKHHAVAPRIFGSVARGEDEPGSDIDLLVESPTKPHCSTRLASGSPSRTYSGSRST